MLVSDQFPSIKEHDPQEKLNVKLKKHLAFNKDKSKQTPEFLKDHGVRHFISSQNRGRWLNIIDTPKPSNVYGVEGVSIIKS